MANITNEFIDSREYATVNEAELNSIDKRIGLFKEYINGLSWSAKDSITVDQTMKLLDYFLQADSIDYETADIMAIYG